MDQQNSPTLSWNKPTTRQCGGCTLCCKLLPMKRDSRTREEIVETIAAMVQAGWATVESFRGMRMDFDKPAGQPCKHQSHHKGCTIYATRPFGCRYWNCRWLVNDDTGDLRRPDRSRYCIDIMPDFVICDPEDGSKPTTVEVVQVWVDPKYPDAWRDPALLAYLDRRGKEGKLALIRLNESDAITVFPPSLSKDGKWHEVPGNSAGREHTSAELWDGLANAKKMVWAP